MRHNSSADKYLKIFTSGYCIAESVDLFLKSKTAHLVRLLQGEIIYTESPCLNFYNVHKTDQGFIIAEALFTDYFPHLEVIGTIIPKRIYQKTKKNHRGHPNSMGASISRHGYAILSDHNPLVEKNNLDKVPFFEIQDDSGVENYTIVQTSNEYQNHKHHYDQSIECYNAVTNEIKNYSPDYLQQKLKNDYNYVSFLFNKNELIKSCSNRSVMVQRMRKGQMQDRHYDNSLVGVDQHFMNLITWYCSDNFKGREMVCGRRSILEFEKWTEKASALDGKTATGLHEDVSGEIIDTLKIRPENGKSIFLNAYNPYFYHGVLEHLGGDPVYTVLNDFGIY